MTRHDPAAAGPNQQADTNSNRSSLVDEGALFRLVAPTLQRNVDAGVEPERAVRVARTEGATLLADAFEDSLRTLTAFLELIASIGGDS